MDQTFLELNIVGTHFFCCPTFLETQIFLGPKLFWGPNFFETDILLRQKCFLDIHFLGTQDYLETQEKFRSQHFWDPHSFRRRPQRKMTSYQKTLQHYGKTQVWLCSAQLVFVTFPNYVWTTVCKKNWSKNLFVCPLGGSEIWLDPPKKIL